MARRDPFRERLLDEVEQGIDTRWEMATLEVLGLGHLCNAPGRLVARRVASETVSLLRWLEVELAVARVGEARLHHRGQFALTRATPLVDADRETASRLRSHLVERGVEV